MSLELARLRVRDLMRIARERDASDLHLAGGAPPVLRVDGELVALDAEPVDAITVAACLTDLLGAAERERFERTGDADGAHRDERLGAFRVHASRSFGEPRLAIRLIRREVPSLEALDLPPVVAALARQRSGLVVFAGPAGSGKSTALAALVHTVNRTTARHIVTVEDPVEHVHAPLRSLVSHREVGADVADFGTALHAVLRADPDVIVIGELRSPPAMAAALTAAETGHLVLTTLHTADATQTIDRISDALGADATAVRTQLAQTLIGVVALRLVARRAGGRRAAAEVLIATEAVRSLIREGKTHQLRNAISTGRGSGMQTLEAHLSELVARGEVAIEVAQAVTDRPAEVRGRAVASAAGATGGRA